jgi:uncharacterized membrane protein YfcA
MPDALAAAFATDGLIWLAAAIFVAGMVRGFSGFGSGLVFLPLASVVLGPVAAITVLIVADFLGPLVLLRRAARDVYWPDLARLTGAMLLALPLGVALLLVMDPEPFRYVLSLLAAAMLACLILGLRYRGRLTPPLVYATGAASGLVGGAVGLPGPPIILLYLASGLPAPVVRATTLLLLFAYDVLMLGLFWLNGRFLAEAVWLGLLLAGPNVAGNWAGGAVFVPGRERLYRGVAYAIIAASAVIGLPLWGL